MMNRYAIVCGLVALTAACASTDKVLSQPPSETVRSSKAASDVAFCLGNKNNSPILERGDGSKVVLVKNGVGAVGAAYAVYPDGSGSRIEIRQPVKVIFSKHRQCY